MTLKAVALALTPDGVLGISCQSQTAWCCTRRGNYQFSICHHQYIYAETVLFFEIINILADFYLCGNNFEVLVELFADNFHFIAAFRAIALLIAETMLSNVGFHFLGKLVDSAEYFLWVCFSTVFSTVLFSAREWERSRLLHQNHYECLFWLCWHAQWQLCLC